MTKKNKIKKKKIIKAEEKLKLNPFKTLNPLFFKSFKQLLIKLFAQKQKKLIK